MGRLPSSSQALSSLGAVGGARGTAAGALRIIVEFLTQYDSKAVKQLETDLKDLANADDALGRKQLGTETALATLREKRLKVEEQIATLISKNAKKPSVARTGIREAERAGITSKEGQRRVTLLDAELNANGKLVDLLNRRSNIDKGINLQLGKQRKNHFDIVGVTEQQVALEEQLSALQRIKANLGPKLGGLALGAVGGIVGGALFGVGFAVADEALSSIGEKLQDLADPARHARELIDDIGSSIRDLAQESGGDLEAAAGNFLKQFGINADDNTRKILAEAAGLQFANEQLAKRKELAEIVNHIDEARAQSVNALAAQLAREAGDAQAALAIEDARYRGRLAQSRIDPFLTSAELQLSGAQQQATDTALEAQRASAALAYTRQQQAAAAQLAAFAEENLVSAISKAAGVQIGRFDAQIDAARSAGPSARTRGLEAQIEKLQNAGNGGQDRGRQQQLANIAEERALILLRQRLRLMGTNINLEKFSGKFLLEAINAKLAALQKEAAAQDRLNRLLDLQFRMSQKLRRNEGESITDFLQRRAQENRDQLTEQRAIERESVEERLRELQEKTQDEVALQDLAEQAKNAAVKSGTDNRIKSLQKELEKSREADRKATEAKIKAIERQKKAYEEGAKTAEHYATVSANAQIREAIRAARTVADLAGLSGQIAGLTAAKNFLSVLLSSGVLSGQEAKDVAAALSRVETTLSSYKAKAILLKPGTHSPGEVGFAGGGYIPLTNASTPFGANVHFGEEGTEGGLLVLPNKIAAAMKGQTGQIGPFYLQGTDNPLKDQYAFKRLVKDAVSEALR